MVGDLFDANRDEVVLFCAVGGGGLISGMAAYVKRIYPNVKIVGVETKDANAMFQSMQQGKVLTLASVNLFADGAAVRRVGEECFRLCCKYVDEIVLVSTDEVCAAIKDVFDETRSVMEPAGALGLAGLKKWRARQLAAQSERGNMPVTMPSLVAVTSGANVNFDRLRFVAERAALGQEKEALISVTIPETPGRFSFPLDFVDGGEKFFQILPAHLPPVCD